MESRGKGVWGEILGQRGQRGRRECFGSRRGEKGFFGGIESQEEGDGASGYDG